MSCVLDIITVDLYSLEDVTVLNAVAHYYFLYSQCWKIF